MYNICIQQMKTNKIYTMLYYFVSGFILLGLVIGICTLHIYRGRVRRKESKKQIAETKERDEIFQTVEPFNSALYIESPIDLNHPDLGYNN